MSCPNCGHPLRQAPSPPEPSERISAWWWLLPVFMTWLGGIIAYLVLHDRNRKTATNMLVFGLVWAFVVAIVYVVAVLAFFFSLLH